jgi:hypothetical protein
MKVATILSIVFTLHSQSVLGFVSPSVSSCCHTRDQYLDSFRSTRKLLHSEPQRRPTSGVNDILVERPDPSTLIAAKPGSEQQDFVFAISGALVFGTFIFINLLSGLENLLPDGWFALWRDYTWPLGLGLVFTAAGVSHFTVKQAFCNIVPPRGCWGGLWKVPHPEFLGLSYEEFHTYWTGIAEIAGGLFLIAAGYDIVDISPSIPSFLLGMLVSSMLLM